MRSHCERSMPGRWLTERAGRGWREGVHSWSRSWMGVKGQQLDVRIGTTAGCAHKGRAGSGCAYRGMAQLDAHKGAGHSWMCIKVQGTAGCARRGVVQLDGSSRVMQQLDVRARVMQQLDVHPRATVACASRGMQQLDVHSRLWHSWICMHKGQCTAGGTCRVWHSWMSTVKVACGCDQPITWWCWGVPEATAPACPW